MIEMGNTKRSVNNQHSLNNQINLNNQGNQSNRNNPSNNNSNKNIQHQNSQVSQDKIHLTNSAEDSRQNRSVDFNNIIHFEEGIKLDYNNENYNQKNMTAVKNNKRPTIEDQKEKEIRDFKEKYQKSELKPLCNTLRETKTPSEIDDIKKIQMTDVDQDDKNHADDQDKYILDSNIDDGQEGHEGHEGHDDEIQQLTPRHHIKKASLSQNIPLVLTNIPNVIEKEVTPNKNSARKNENVYLKTSESQKVEDKYIITDENTKLDKGRSSYNLIENKDDSFETNKSIGNNNNQNIKPHNID